MENNNTNNYWGVILGLGIGALIGAATALLVTPVNGEEARRLIRERALGQLRSKAQELRVNVADIVDETRDRFKELSRKGVTTP